MIGKSEEEIKAQKELKREEHRRQKEEKRKEYEEVEKRKAHQSVAAEEAALKLGKKKKRMVLKSLLFNIWSIILNAYICYSHAFHESSNSS